VPKPLGHSTFITNARPGAPLIAYFAMSGFPLRTDGRGSNPFSSQTSSVPRHRHPTGSCATMFPDVSQPRCANPNQGHPGRAQPVISNPLINMYRGDEWASKAAQTMNFERMRQETELSTYSGRF
jgi:hypothetical protein